MGKLMLGAKVVKDIRDRITPQLKELDNRGITPAMAIIRVGENPDDLAYQRYAVRTGESFGIKTFIKEFPEDVKAEVFLNGIEKTGRDRDIHGILLLRPLPPSLSEERAGELIPEEKDIDGFTQSNMAKIYAGDATGFSPCTPEGIIEMLKYYRIPIEGSNTVIVGRSMVVGRPLAMLMLKENATVTLCHTRTRDLPSVTSKADILVAAVGRPGVIGKEHVKEGACVIDVGINLDENNKLCGDVDFDGVVERAGYITPVPKGVGTVTNAILAKHTIEACMKLNI